MSVNPLAGNPVDSGASFPASASTLLARIETDAELASQDVETSQNDEDLISAVRSHRKARFLEREEAAKEKLFKSMARQEEEAELNFNQNNLGKALIIYRALRAKLRIMIELFPQNHLQGDLIKFNDRITTLERERDELQAKQLLDTADAEFKLIQADLQNDLNALPNLIAAESCKGKLAALKKRYELAKQLAPSLLSKYRELIQIYDELETRIEQLKLQEIETSMGSVEDQLRNLSLQKADDLAQIQKTYQDWIVLLGKLPPDKKAVYKNTCRGMESIFEQAYKASLLLMSLKDNSFLIKLAKNALGEQGVFPEESQPSFTNLCKSLFTSQICNEWISLTPDGITHMQQAITDHIRRFFKYSCYSKTTTLRSSCQAITEEAANQWMKQALAKGKILDVVDRLNGPHPNPDPPDFKEEEGVRNGPSAMALITPSTSPDNGGESD